MTPKPRRNSRLSLDDKALTKRASLSLPTVMTLESWKDIGREIALISDASTWWLGDWVVYGQDRYPDRYRKAIEETSLDYQTLRNYAWVARKFPVSRRREKLSLQHHAEVAALQEDEQDVWLNRAESKGWSRSELRRNLRAIRADREETTSPSILKLSINLDADQRRRWERAADRSNRSLDAWITETLDDAARSPRASSFPRLPAAS
uniref:LmbU and cloE-like protein n=1 Tax=Streptomyces argenteolus TaxID=67274 RepID=A9ZNW1_9ACTN|nr:lmbU and cloE-like protein [Streptomyces argenteolus]